MANLHVPNLEGADAKLAEAMFEFVQFLLDDDANMTPAGSLTAVARQKLRDRMAELIAAEDTSKDVGPEVSDAPPPAPLDPAPSEVAP
jgi:hypothetical protein